MSEKREEQLDASEKFKNADAKLDPSSDEAKKAADDLIKTQRADLAEQKNTDRKAKYTSRTFGRVELLNDDGEALVKGYSPEVGGDLPMSDQLRLFIELDHKFRNRPESLNLEQLRELARLTAWKCDEEGSQARPNSQRHYDELSQKSDSERSSEDQKFMRDHEQKAALADEAYRLSNSDRTPEDEQRYQKLMSDPRVAELEQYQHRVDELYRQRDDRIEAMTECARKLNPNPFDQTDDQPRVNP